MQLSVQCWPCMGSAYVVVTATDCCSAVRGDVMHLSSTATWEWRGGPLQDLQELARHLNEVASTLLYEGTLPSGWVETDLTAG